MMFAIVVNYILISIFEGSRAHFRRKFKPVAALAGGVALR